MDHCIYHHYDCVDVVRARTHIRANPATDEYIRANPATDEYIRANAVTHLNAD